MALSSNQVIKRKAQPVEDTYGVVDGAITIYKGALLNFEAANIGYMKLASDTSSEEFAGVALDYLSVSAADNTSDGTYEMKVLKRGCGQEVQLTTTDTITVANIGDIVYANGDDAVALAGTTTNDVPVGTIRQFVDSNTAMVQLDQ